MVNGISTNSYTYNNEGYVQRSNTSAIVGFCLASAAASGVTALLPYFSKSFLKQMHIEHGNNDKYRDIFYRAVDNSGLKEKGLYVQSLEFTSPSSEKIYTLSGKKTAEGEIKAGLNADYAPKLKRIRINDKRTTISGFHELGHAMNHLNGGFGRMLQKMRAPGYALAGLMGTVALFSRRKPKGADRDAWDVLQDNCGKIAFAAILPTVAEEALASHKGIKMAKQAGLSKDLAKNLKKFYGKALLSYIGYAVITGLAVFASSKITEIFTRPKYVPSNYSSFNEFSA